MTGGMIFDIQGHSVHDGPGSRTAVFLAGCPLACFWCSNPEGQRQSASLLYSRAKCVHEHHRCIAACPVGAVSVGAPGETPEFDRTRCDSCDTFECVDVCYSDAVRVSGHSISLDELMRTLARHRAYWGADGGVTFTGGEPLQQFGFLAAALDRCRTAFIHTALETSLYAPWEHVEEILPLVDFMFVDLKHMNPDRHQFATGVANDLILKNFRQLATVSSKPRIVVRIPVVPGLNDDDGNIRATAEFITGLGLDEVNLLPLHRLGLSKWEQLGRPTPLAEITPSTPERMTGLKSIIEAAGLSCYLGNETPF